MEELEEEEGAPILFRCPISMELMVDPVTISTGITYDRKNIKNWFSSYNKLTCPATMQRLESFDLTPNHTLNRLIDSWRQRRLTPSTIEQHDNLLSLLTDIESAPFKMSSLKRLQTLIGTSESVRTDFIKSGGIQVLIRIMSQIIVFECAGDFSAFRACEESVGVLHFLPLSDPTSVELLSNPECMKPMMLILQRGSAEARQHTMTILLKLSRTGKDWMLTDRELDITKSLLELLSDDISTKLSSSSLDVLIEIVAGSKKNRRKAIEAGAVCVTVELLSTVANRNKCEKLLMLLKELCDCPEGRAAFVDHGLGVAVVSKKILRVSELATKLGVKILSVVCDYMPTEKVIDEMMVFGAVRKMFGLLHIDGRSSTKDKAMKMIRLHGGVWKRYPCFPCEIKEYLKLVHV